MMEQVPLDANAVYLTPTGRRCKWVPLGGNRLAWCGWTTFAYIAQSSKIEDGFSLSPGNLRILRKEASDAAAR